MSGGEAAAPNATPRAVDLAGELGIDLAGLEGSGRRGKVTIADVRKAAADQRRAWGDIRAYLDEIGLWREAFTDLIDRYLRNLARARSASAAADEQPSVEGSNGQTVANPLYAVARNAELDAQRYAEALLITPAALRRQAGEAGDGKDDDLGF